MPPDLDPTMGKVVGWISDLGGYIGKSAGVPPGAMTIRGGLDLISPVAAALEQLDVELTMR